MIPGKRPLFLLLAAALSSGCVATQQDVAQLERQVDRLNSNIATMQKNQADLSSKMDRLSGNLASYGEDLRDFNLKVSDLSTKLDDVQAKMDSLETGIEAKINTLGQALKKQQDDIKKQQDETMEAVLPSRIFSESYTLLVRKNYERAAQGFQLYLEKYPDSENAENAYYYLGEALAGQNKWQEAAVAYATILDKFRDSRQTSSVRLKYALALLKLPGNNKDEASRYLKSVIQDFPDTPQARLSRDVLKTIEPDYTEAETKPEKKKEKAPEKPSAEEE